MFINLFKLHFWIINVLYAKCVSTLPSITAFYTTCSSYICETFLTPPIVLCSWSPPWHLLNNTKLRIPHTSAWWRFRHHMSCRLVRDCRLETVDACISCLQLTFSSPQAFVFVIICMKTSCVCVLYERACVKTRLTLVDGLGSNFQSRYIGYGTIHGYIYMGTCTVFSFDPHTWRSPCTLRQILDCPIMLAVFDTDLPNFALHRYLFCQMAGCQTKQKPVRADNLRKTHRQKKN